MITPRTALRRLRIRLLPVPAQALGLAVLVAVLAAALVSAPLMVASAEDGTWKQERERLSETAVGATLLSSSIAGRQQSSPERITRAAELNDAVVTAAQRAGLTPPVFMNQLRDPLLFATATGGGITQLVHRTGAQNHVDITAGSWSDDNAAAIRALEAMRLGHLAERVPDEVSLGEQQRTALARALVLRPAFLVADEPTGRLDEELSTHVLTTLHETCAETGTGVLIASHDPVVVAAADRVVRLSDGRVEPTG